jgi:4-diphosphocytidyl-2-C-methyl-D-erythritol kinase
MVVFPNAKINLGLRILRKRPDGYHDLETVFYPLPLHDALEIIPPHDNHSSPAISITGQALQGPSEDNLCIKAWQLLKKDFPSLPAVLFHLHKAIPSGAGLGGGSADASFTLRLLNKQYQLGLPEVSLSQYALQLGSDCPFFLVNKPCLATGRGEQLEPIEVALDKYSIVLINPGIHVSTARAFSMLVPSIPEKDIRSIIRQPIHTWRAELKNDFERPVFDEYPEIKRIKEQLYQAGALYASMSGSGSSVYGLFEKTATPVISLPDHYFIKHL